MSKKHYKNRGFSRFIFKKKGDPKFLIVTNWATLTILKWHKRGPVSTKICQKKGHQKNDNFAHFPKHRLIKKPFCCNPPFDQIFFFFCKLFVWKSKTLMLNKKHTLKSGNSKDKKKELETKKDRKPKKREKLMKTKLAI